MELVKELIGPDPPVVIEPVNTVFEPEEQFSRLIDSRIFPGLIYDMFQTVGIHENQSKGISPSVFWTLYFLENQSGFADRALFLESCWSKETRPSTCWNAIYAANKFLGDIGISRVITCGNDALQVE